MRVAGGGGIKGGGEQSATLIPSFSRQREKGQNLKKIKRGDGLVFADFGVAFGVGRKDIEEQ